MDDSWLSSLIVEVVTKDLVLSSEEHLFRVLVAKSECHASIVELEISHFLQFKGVFSTHSIVNDDFGKLDLFSNELSANADTDSHLIG